MPNTTQVDQQERLAFALSIAREAGDITLQYFKKELEVIRKSDNSPVTIADREAEQWMRDRIQKVFPTDGILGEEHGEQAGTSGYRWILDPIDGTKSFIHGVPLYGVLVGVEFDGQSVIGVIGIPASNEYYFGAKGQGAWQSIQDREKEAIRVSDVDSLKESLFCTTSVSTFENLNRGEVYKELRAKSGLARGWGDCYGYTLVATGRAEVMVDPEMSIWDAAALLPILEEAGGTFTDWNGNPTIDGKEGIATNSKVLDEVLSITKTK